MLRPLGFQAHLWPDVTVTGAPQGAPCRQQGAGDRVPKPPPHPWHSILSVPGLWPPLASLWFGGLTLGFPCQAPPGLGSFPSLSPGEESLHIPQCWPLRTAACLAMRVVHFFVPLQHPPLLHSSPTPQLGTGGRSPATVLLVETAGKDHKFLQDPGPAPQKPGVCSPRCPNLHPGETYGGRAREHGVVPSVGLGRSRDPRQMSQEWNPAVPTGGFCGTQKGKRKGTEGCICFSRGSSLIVEA